MNQWICSELKRYWGYRILFCFVFLGFYGRIFFLFFGIGLSRHVTVWADRRKHKRKTRQYLRIELETKTTTSNETKPTKILVYLDTNVYKKREAVSAIFSRLFHFDILLSTQGYYSSNSIPTDANRNCHRIPSPRPTLDTNKTVRGNWLEIPGETLETARKRAKEKQTNR